MAGTEVSTRLDIFSALFHMHFTFSIVGTKEQQPQFSLNGSVSIVLQPVCRKAILFVQRIADFVRVPTQLTIF
jgi:hypothetical protein